MVKYRKIIFAVIFQLLILAPSFSQKPVVEKGILDLRGWNWNTSSEIALKGEWRFYWNEFIDPVSNPEPTQYIDVPSAWNKLKLKDKRIGPSGYGSYKLTILIDPAIQNLAIHTTIISTAFDLFVDGDKIQSVGTPGISKETTTPQYLPTISSFDNDGSIEVVLHVANFHHRVGGIRDRITIGKGAFLYRSYHNEMLIDLFLAGCFIMMAVYHLVLYLITRDKSPLYFSIFSLVMTIRLFVTGNIPISYFTNIDWNFLIRIEYLSFYLGGVSFLAFFYSLFHEFVPSRMVRIVHGFLLFMSLLVVVLSTNLFTSMLFVSQAIIIIVFFYIFYILIKAHQSGNKEAIVFLSGYGLMVIFFINDLLHADEIIETAHLFSVGLFLFLISQAVLLSRRYSQSFKRNEVLLLQLNSSNKILESKVSERTSILEKQKEVLEQNNIHIKQQNEELIKLNKELDNFVYSVSHDLKAPLASMLGLIDLSRDEEDLDTLKHYHEMMERSLSRQKEFISEILDYSRNARLDLKEEPIDFKNLLDKTMEQFQFIDQWNQIEKVIDIDQQDEFKSDQQRISIILNNLISNALKYSTVANNLPKVQITIRANKKQADFTISDNGCGIPEDKIDKIFDMFYRADDHKSGSGLGLYIVNETLTKLNASIKVDSVYGDGTTVYVTVPATTAK